ncbi:LamG-like jellyroll fold domain-containing protein, partial [Arthrospira platensis SPKY2]
WQHIAFTYNHTTNQAKLFRNGQFLAQGTFTYTSPRNASSNILAGSSNTHTTQGFDGAIDNVRLWNIARTEAEILADFEVCLNGDETGLIAYYDFENVTENSIPNIVGANNTG